MSDFTRQPLEKKLNRQNILSRLEQAERNYIASPSARVGALSEISQDLGDARRGVMQVRVDGSAAIMRLNRFLLFSTQATPTIILPQGCLSGHNIVEIILTGEFYQNTGSAQTITPRLYIGKSGSETLVTSDTALSVASGTTRKAFEYRVRISAAPAGGVKVRADEFFNLETATAGTLATIMRSTKTTVIDITQLFEINSCFMRIANSATATMFRIYTNTLTIQVLDAVQADEIHWYSQLAPADAGDTFISAGLPTTNYGTNILLQIGEDNTAVGYKYHTLLKFPDLSNFTTDPDLIGFQLSEAYIYLNINIDRSSNARTFRFYRLLVDWVEGEATWNIRKTSTNWGTGGGQAGVDYDATAIATASFGSAEIPGIAKAFAFTAYGIAELQKILDGIYTNYGFIGIADTETDDAYLFYSSDSIADYAPMLYLIGSKPN